MSFRFLLTNDDGIDAPGIRVLEEVARDFGEVVVVAPSEGLSGCSHRTTTDRPLSYEQVAEHRFSVDGTPADCVRLGLLRFAADVDWVLSGVNNGGNLGVDVWMSGTAAAAREAAWRDRKAIALSQYRAPNRPRTWEATGEMTRRVLSQLIERELAPKNFWNINFPDAEDGNGAEIVVCPLDPHPLPADFELTDGALHYRGNYHQRKRQPDADVDVCFSGRIAVSEVSGGW